MGQSALAFFNTPQAPAIDPFRFLQAPQLGTPQPSSQVPSNPQADTLELGQNPESEITSAYEGTVYRAQSQSVAMHIGLSQASGSVSTGENGAAEASFQAQQLTFDFFAESRSVEVASFRERSQEVAEGLEGTRQTRYSELSQSVSASFEMSFTVSGEALSGFANASEALQDQGPLFDQMLEMGAQLLEQAEGLFGEFLGLFGGAGGGQGQEGLREMMEQMIQGFFGEEFGFDLFGQQALEANGDAGGASASTQQIQMEFEFSFSFSGEISVTQGEIQQSDPIMFDLDGDGFELTNHANGARFDIQGNGEAVNTAFVTGGDAFLAIDRNKDGQINSGLELFGDQHGAANGYEELRKLDSNNDGVLNSQDDAFDDLLLFRDNGNGITEQGELLTLADMGITEISLDYANIDQRAAGGNRLAQMASFRYADGSQGRTADAILNFTA